MTTGTHRAELDAQMSEEQWSEQVIAYASLRSWLVAHFRPARTAHGWRTPVSADGKGFPDLVLVRDRAVLVELKSVKGTLTEEQARWLEALKRADVEHYLWRPTDWPEVERVLA